jgi:hypothetical protein
VWKWHKYTEAEALTWYEVYKDFSIPVARVTAQFKVKHCTMMRAFKRLGLPLRPSGFRVNNLRGRPGEAAEGLLRRQYLWLYKFAYMRRAEKKQLEFTLSEDQFIALVTSDCFYCGLSYTQETRIVYRRPLAMLSVDRIDSNKGYTPENCVPACKHCNTIKMDASMEEFLNKIKLIHEKHCKP